MLAKIASGFAFITSLSFASNVPADLSVNAFNATTLNKAVEQVLGAKPAAEAKEFRLNFANDDDLRKALNELARNGPRKVYRADACAIPLLEVKGGNGRKLDPLARPAGKANFDAIGKPTPIGPCSFRAEFGK